ncbi:TonB-dependent receptor domain-containing protein [Altererythrobacter sp. Root672]|uniref:TonB-dependent receptor domain-containing protein n=1 Tax=Altererythrobacter sp. Root672 TaxID=1736584 RepID=UPI0006F277C3|nr:TonB-dependent receptor [Altererythrobacter sp. Root672]KRA82698.1 hypothetical protein ASD76_00960 [Altererythrobacter sp. Root672]
MADGLRRRKQGLSTMRSLHSFLASTAVLGLAALVSQPAFGQEIDLSQGEGESEVSEVILVTGSRIARPNIDAPVPVTSITGEELFQQGQTNIGETLNQLPQLRSTVAQQNPGLGIGVAGLNLLDLRGLGTERTLVLVNGRRHIGGDVSSNAVSPDVNTIPNDLIERVDIVTGANSAIYGSDAIAGVVNFILKKDFEGFQVRGNAGISQGGYGENQYISAMYGKNFAGGRGNITLHGEFANQERIFASDISFLRQQDGLFVTDADAPACTSFNPARPTGCSPNTVNGGDGIPDRVFIRDVRSATINRFGLVPIVQPEGANALCGTGISNGITPGVPYNCTYIFTPEGQLVPQTGARFGAGAFGGVTGGNGQTGREGHLLSVLPEMQRYNANLLARYEFSEAAEAFLEAKFVRIDAIGSNSGPTFIQGTMSQFDSRERVRLDNPFLNLEARSTLANAILASGFNSSLNTRVALSATDRAAIADGSYRFVVARNLADSGIRDQDFQRDTYRIVGGLRGTFNDDWSYEISGNYGKMKEATTNYGFVDRQRFVLAMDAGLNPVTGAIECRAKFDPASAVAFTQGLSADSARANQERLAADVAACVPYNPFGGADNSASANYFVYTGSVNSWMDQLVFNGFVSGDSSEFLMLPGGPVSFALGAEYRRERVFQEQDAFTQAGFTNNVAIPTFEPSPFEVKEAFAELRVPILSDLPFVEELTINGAGRVSDYKGGVGTVWAYNAGLEWAPVRDIRFRANFGRAVRAPNLTEISDPLVENFATGFQDPCLPTNIGRGTQFRGANCEAALGSILADPNFQSIAGSYSLAVVSGSNPDLHEETSDSWTIGAAVQPRFAPGLSLSVDYYDITVNGVIVSLAAQTIANSCYDQPDLNNPFCPLFKRNGAGVGPNGEAPGEIIDNSLIQSPLNFAKRQRRGIDFDVRYKTALGTDVSLDTRLVYTHQLKSSNYQDPARPEFENRLLGELGDPQDEFRWDVALNKGPFTLGYQMSYIGPMWVNAYEDFNALQDRAPQDIDYADTRKYPAVFYHDIRFNWQVASESNGRELDFFVGVDNVLNTRPPLGSTATGAGSAIYNIRGRNFYTGFKAGF